MHNKNFRYDINGLRAYAVILVVLFHFGIIGFAAGFIGVDIFFVISGFLMTSIVIKSLDKGNFSLLKFYLARGIRIVPALFVVSTIVLILGWFLVLPTDYKALAKHTLSSINFFSNIVYWRESGYFDTDSHNKALLHTWSLSVEWQFYLVFPIIVALLYKIKKSRNFLLTFFILGTIISLILSIIITAKNPSAGFFLLPTRAWEMLAGGLIFFIPKEKVPYKKPLEFIGFFLIAISCYIFSTDTLWPSYNAILPVLGAFLILLAHQQNSIFTKGSVFQWLGNNSYSIYLWHWPIVFFLHYFYKNDDYIFITAGIILSIILGWLSYTYIENPTRKKLSNLSIVKAYFLWFLSISILSLISIMIFKFDGVKNRFSNEINNISNTINDINPRRDECLGKQDDSQLKKCTYGDGPLSLIVVGDSHASAMLNGVINALPNNTSLISFTISGCPTVKNLKKTNMPEYSCGERVKDIINDIKTNYSTDIPILVINRANAIFQGEPENDKSNQPIRYINTPSLVFDEEYYAQMRNAYVDTLKDLSASHKVYITRPTPEAKKEISNLAAKIFKYHLPTQDLTITWNEYYERSKQAWKAQDMAAQSTKNIQIIDLSREFCDNETCYFTQNNLPLFYDDDHMSWTASLKLAPIFKKEIFDK
ncbi:MULTISPECIES: acyltransferase family protein [unclassified Acinetobacter]|jgi:peptidoglycan/LPS O-acetylase OafA/YrhL|uniref:acyltransferase family protein n=1 Tax=unclassified Acinetobacter TaxID=196816 RepID=UPI0015D422D1|nr:MULTISPECIES: acyltransferase family protein [unclassified Acinetobacter]